MRKIISAAALLTLAIMLVDGSLAQDKKKDAKEVELKGKICCNKCELSTGTECATVIVVKDVEEAIEVANDNVFGLSCGIITRDLQKGLAVADRIGSGMVHINESSTADEPHVPFGGVKDSGWGKMGGKQAAEEFMELRWITFQTTPRHYPL